jgi:hypothetical protein
MEIKAPQPVIREKARQELKGAVQLIQKNFGIEPDMMCDMLKSILSEYQEAKAAIMSNLALSMALENMKEEIKDDKADA